MGLPEKRNKIVSFFSKNIGTLINLFPYISTKWFHRKRKKKLCCTPVILQTTLQKISSISFPKIGLISIKNQCSLVLGPNCQKHNP